MITEEPLRFGLFANGAAKEGAICAFDIVRQVRRSGHTMSLYAPQFDGSADLTVAKVFERRDLDDIDWWRNENLDRAIFYSVEAFSPDTLRLARQSGATVIVECDSDGHVSPLQSPLSAASIGAHGQSAAFIDALAFGEGMVGCMVEAWKGLRAGYIKQLQRS